MTDFFVVATIATTKGILVGSSTSIRHRLSSRAVSVLWAALLGTMQMQRQVLLRHDSFARQRIRWTRLIIRVFHEGLMLMALTQPPSKKAETKKGD